MELFNETPNWAENLKPLIALYKRKKHPLNYENTYQLLVMVILSAQDSDANINKIAPALFEVYPNMENLAVSNIEVLIPYISKVRNFGTKANWLIEIAQTLTTDSNIPATMDELVALKGIGRKSANVIMRETKQPAEGIIADLHVIEWHLESGLFQKPMMGTK